MLPARASRPTCGALRTRRRRRCRSPPGASARSLLHWGVVPVDDERGTECEPVATAVVVTPPDQTSAALLPWTSGPVCEHGLIRQNAYVPGSDPF